MEVVVTFPSGDTDRPILLGALYNGANPPPFPLPARKTQSGIRTRSTPGGEGSNELRFDDAAGQEQVYLHAQKDLVEVIEDAHATDVRGKQHLRVAKTRSVEILEDHVRTVSGNEVVTIHKNMVLHVVGSQVIQIDGASEELEPDEPPAPNVDLGAPGAAQALDAAAAGGTPDLPSLKATVERAIRRRSALLVWLAEQVPDEAYERAAALQEAAARVADDVGAVYVAARKLAEETPLEAIANEAAPIFDRVDEARGAVAALLAKALEPAPAAFHRFQNAAIESLRAIDAMAKEAEETLVRATEGKPPLPSSLDDIAGSGRGGGGGENVFTLDRSGKGSSMNIAGGAIITSKDGFKIVAGASSIEITDGKITIDGPIVDIKGKPINLNC